MSRSGGGCSGLCASATSGSWRLYDDAVALEELCRRSDAVTYEFENVPGSVLIPLEKNTTSRRYFRPLNDSQDRLREKDNARDDGLATREYAAADVKRRCGPLWRRSACPPC